MNKARKQQIKNEILSLNHIVSNLNDLLDQENDYYDNIPENLQSSIRADNSEEAIDILGESISSLEEIIDNLKNI